MSLTWGRILRHVFVAVITVAGGSAAFGSQPQSPIESYIARGHDSGMVMPASAEMPVSCAAGCGAVAQACDGGCDTWCGNALDYFAPGSDNCGCNTWTFGGELLILKGFNSAGALAQNYQGGFRFWGAWQRPDGLGLRLRYFDYDNAGAGTLVDTDSLDIEVMDSLQLGCNWTLIVAGGLRYTDFTTVGNDFHGLGPVVSAELYRTINCNTQLYGITRSAILFDDGANPGGIPNSTMSVSEIQIGIQRTWDLDSGALAFGRFGWEAQWYDDSATGGVSSVSLQGLNFSLGVIY